MISVAGIDSLGIDPAKLPFDRLGDPLALERGDPIFLLGHPNGLPWRVNTVAERFIERRTDFLDFESNLIAAGHSGGALLNGSRELVGMLKSDQAPYGEAISIVSIGKQLSTWGYDEFSGAPAQYNYPPAIVAPACSRQMANRFAGATTIRSNLGR